MHQSEEHHKEAKKHHLNIIVAGHMVFQNHHAIHRASDVGHHHCGCYLSHIFKTGEKAEKT